MKYLLTISMLLLFSIPALPQKVTLSDQDVAAAVQDGVKNKKHHFGLRLEDQTTNFWNAMANANKPAYAWSEAKGFSLEAFTPISWISECAALSSRQYIPFTVANVTDEMKASILYIVVHGKHSKSAGTAGSASGGTMSAESVAHVVIRSEDKKSVLQPSKLIQFDQGQQNVFGATAEFDGMKVEFPMEEVAKIRSLSADSEFFVTVVGENSEKDFKIKKKHFEKLP